MVAARTPRQMIGFDYDSVINAIDWNRVLIQARGLHERVHAVHAYFDGTSVCGECLRSVLLRFEE